jgi:hypothetical protein
VGALGESGEVDPVGIDAEFHQELIEQTRRQLQVLGRPVVRVTGTTRRPKQDCRVSLLLLIGGEHL